MALINCYECGTEISDQAAACPKCGAAQTKRAKVKATKAAKDKAREEFAKTPEGKKQQRIGLAIMAAVTVGVLWMCSGSGEKNQSVSGSLPQTTPEQEAYTLCKEAIGRKFGDPSRVHFPPMKNHGTPGKEHYFAWGKDNPVIGYESIESTTPTAHTASCITNASGTTITGLTFDGKDVN